LSSPLVASRRFVVQRRAPEDSDARPDEDLVISRWGTPHRNSQRAGNHRRIGQVSTLFGGVQNGCDKSGVGRTTESGYLVGGGL
jgi:hypothetical protein